MLFDALLGLRKLASDQSMPSPLDDFWYQPFSGPPGSMQVTRDSAMRQAAVYACVRVLSESLASVPLNLMRRLPDGGSKPAEDHPLYPLLHFQPNPRHTSMQWRELAMAEISLRGLHVSEIIADRRGKILALEPIPRDTVKLKKLPTGRVVYEVRRPNLGVQTLTQDEVFAVGGLTLDGVTPLSPIEYQRQTMATGALMAQYNTAFYKNNARPAGVIQKAAFPNAEKRKEFLKSWKDTYGGANQHSMAILEYGMEYKEMGMTHTDAQFLEFMNYNLHDICRIFRVPPHLVMDLVRATNNNIEQQGIEFITLTMLPNYVRWEQAAKRDLISEPDIFLEFDASGLMRGDTLSVYNAYRMAIMTGWMTRNEVRNKQNMEPLEGLDEPWEPTNMAAVGSQSERQPGQETPEGTVARAAQAEEFARVLARKLLHREKEAVLIAAKRYPQGGAKFEEALEGAYAKLQSALTEDLRLSDRAAARYVAAQLATVKLNGVEAIEKWSDEHVAHLANLALEVAA